MEALFNATPDGILLLGVGGTVLAINRSCADGLGIALHEVIGKNFLSLLPAHWELSEYSQLKNAIQTSTHLRFETTREDRWLSVRFIPIINKEAPDLCGVLYVRDITERRRSQDVIRESEERFRHVLENSQVASYRWNVLTERYDYLSPVIELMTGYKANEVAAWSKERIFSLVHPDERSKFQHTFTGYATHTGAYEIEYRFFCADAVFRWFSDVGTIVRDTAGAVLFHIGAVRNIEDHKAVEKALRQSEERYRNLAEAAGDMIITVDLDGTATFVNEATRSFLGGFDPVGLNIKDFVPADLVERQRDMIEKRRRGFTDHLLYEWRAISPATGKEIMTEVRSSLLTEEGTPSGVLFIARDITNRKKIEAEREQLIKQLTEALSRIKTLSGLLPICASCKKIRNDEGYWEQLELYIKNHSDADFTHGICPECARKLYPNFVK